MMELRLRQKPGSRAEEHGRRRSAPATVISLFLHVILAVVLWNALKVPDILERLLDTARKNTPVQEHVVYAVVQPEGAASANQSAPATPVQTRGEPSSAPPLIAPSEVPSQLPPVPPPASTPRAQPEAGGTGTGNGPLNGGNGPTRGVKPTYNDPRVWVPDPGIVYAPKTETERLDSALVSTLQRAVDSLGINTYIPNKFERGDWTVDHGGEKWGIDQQYIHLGRFSLPTALLALLPLNRMQANPIDLERQRNLTAMRSDIMYHAQAAMNEAEFRKAVKAIRERKDRERKEKEQKKGGSAPIVSPGDRPPG